MVKHLHNSKKQYYWIHRKMKMPKDYCNFQSVLISSIKKRMCRSLDQHLMKHCSLNTNTKQP